MLGVKQKSTGLQEVEKDTAKSMMKYFDTNGRSPRGPDISLDTKGMGSGQDFW